ncbi:MAG: acetate--CoA ligase [Candidatus Protochlamydia sp.]|nr:acetate--CoA ligase [Candidatus Protochlamydia sp.]
MNVLNVSASLACLNLLTANETLIEPTHEFKTHANIQSFEIFEEANQDREAFWAKQAAKLHWFSPWDCVLDWKPPHAKWFQGGKINASYNCLDIHMHTDTKHKTALIWEGEKGEQRTLTYEELYLEVNKFSHVLKSLGVQKGDRVAIYLPMIPEAAVAMLACARIGAVHVVVFGGFSAEALQDRIQDAEAKVIVTADGSIRKGSFFPLKSSVDQALKNCSTVENVIVVNRASQAIEMSEGRDHWYHQCMKNASEYYEPEQMDAEDTLFILYTSGTTGKPKGILHTTGGYLTGTKATTNWVFDVKPSDIYWCTADIGWITGHSYIIYGPLLNGMTQLIYEGSLDWPEKDRTWDLIEKHKVTTLYTAPTAIRTFMKWGEGWLKKHNLSSLRLLGSVGEPINPEAWMWYFTHIGHQKCPIVDTWWQTETGSILIAPIPGLSPLKPGSATVPLPGIEAAIIGEDGDEKALGSLVILSPWPSMLRGIYKDQKRFEESYWKKINSHYYFTGDSARKDEDGYFWLLGRMDDVINVSGHRLGSAEIESALVDHPNVAEAAVISIYHSIKGQAIAAFVTLKEGVLPNEALADLLKMHVVKKIGAIARPEKIIFVSDLPKTRSGKIMRRLLRDIAEGRTIGDVTTLIDPSMLNELKKDYEED